MDYRAELQILLDGGGAMNLEDWLKLYPIEEYPGLINEYKIFMQKFLIEEGDFETVQKLEDELNYFSDYIQNLTIDRLAEKQEKRNQAEALLKKVIILQENFAQRQSKEFAVSEELVNELRDVVKYLKNNNLCDEETLKKFQHLLNNE